MIEADEQEGSYSRSDSFDKEDLFNENNVSKEDLAIVSNEGTPFPGIVKTVEERGAEVSVMQKNQGIGWKWPKKVDQVLYFYSDILEKLSGDVFKPYNNRGIFIINSAHLAKWGD